MTPKIPSQHPSSNIATLNTSPTHKNDSTLPTANQLPNYRMALNFLNEIALMSFRADKGIYPATAPATCQQDYSGDLKPATTKNKGPMTLPPQKLPYSWPDLNPSRHRSLPNKQNQKPGPANPATELDQSKKRPNSPHPWEFCNKCFIIGDHYSESCHEPAPKPCPTDLDTKIDPLKKINQIAHNRHKTKEERESRQQ